MPLPEWLQTLRRTEIVEVVKRHPTTGDGLVLGIHPDEIFREVLGGGQADFDQPYQHLTGDDRALLYSYFNQLGHLEELFEAFTQIFADRVPDEPFIVVDLGCGPFTGGLALAAVLGPGRRFTYIGLDRAATMRALGERLAVSAEILGALTTVDRQWVPDFNSIIWPHPPSWRPVFVIASYILASAVLDVNQLVTELDSLCERFGRGPMMVLYTNSISAGANRHFGDFRTALQAAGFEIVVGGDGSITAGRWGGARERKLRYALFRRAARRTLEL